MTRVAGVGTLHHAPDVPAVVEARAVDRQPNQPAHRRVRRGTDPVIASALLALGLTLVAGVAPAAASTSSAPPPVSSVTFDDSNPSPGPSTGRRPHWPVGPADDEPAPPGPAEKVNVVPSMDLFRAAGFRYQDPNYAACTATSAMDMLNFIALTGTGGAGFRWRVDRSWTTRDAILAWERTHDTLAGGKGSDPHGWRNALNGYGWGSGALGEATRVYDDYVFSTYDRAMKAAIRALLRTRKPVGIVAWEGRHAQMLTGFDGLVGDPFARVDGVYTNTFTVANLRLSDPLSASGRVDARIAYRSMAISSDLTIRYRPYYETDSPYDDPYTAGVKPAAQEWYGRYVLLLPKR